MIPDPYKDIELTPEEIEAALYEGKKKKYFHEKSKEYWQERETTKDDKPKGRTKKTDIQTGEHG
jgi:hypothetical protein